MSAPISLERATVGAVLVLPLADARRVLATIRDNDPDDPRLRSILECARTLADQGIRPDAPTVLAQALSNGLPSSSRNRMAVELADLISIEACPIPTHATTYAAGLVQQAVRRRISEAADRLRQLADEGTLEALTDVTQAECIAICQAVNRLGDHQILGGAA